MKKIALAGLIACLGSGCATVGGYPAMSALPSLESLGSTLSAAAAQVTSSEAPASAPASAAVTPPPQPETVASKLMASGAQPTARPGVLTLETPALNGNLIAVEPPSKPIPDVQVAELTLDGSSLQQAVLAVLAGTGVPFVIVGEPAASTTTVVGVSGSLESVLNTLSRNFGFFYHYDGSALQITATRTFALPVPPTAGVQKSVEDSLKALGATGITLDAASSTVLFTATRPVADRVQLYTERLHGQFAQIVYDIRVVEVQLSDGTQTGVQWNKLTLGSNATITSGSGSSGVPSFAGLGGSLAAVLNLGHGVTVDAVVSFLDTQGKTKVLSRPQLVVLSGGSANKLHVGGVRKYVSQIGAATAATGGGVGGAGGTTTYTAQTSDLNTGLQLEVAGQHLEGTVYTDLKLKITSLQQMDEVRVGESSFKLPETAEKSLTEHFRMRPGDTIAIGGMLVERDDANDQSFLGLLPLAKSASKSRSELVVLVQPTLVQFVPARPQ